MGDAPDAPPRETDPAPGADPAAETAFYESLPRVRGAATALLREAPGGRVLLVDPVYRPGWGLPGGVVEEGESPLAACIRECAEELGLHPRLDTLVAVDWIPPHTTPNRRPALIHVFGGLLPPRALDRLRLPPDELAAAELLTPEQAADRLPADLARRTARALQAQDAGTTVYLEHGRPAPWTA
ncbi:NUDIX domain-containing protein [Nocardiopsis halophila]|uniref:NUDIX domain-containing protein n=1 Tax=Nocardiopsis halophila TaxID=141692 RepID=UPI0003496006|nr:NUDIX hydrolase [Nocardiopsis halophila]